jgi:c-di-GMP-binding flagellar brake protein YcgR
LPILILIIILLCLGYWWFSRSKKTGRGNWIQFFARGKEAGFSFKELETLRLVAVQCGLADPCSLFTSQNQLDKCLFVLVQHLKESGESEDREAQDFLSRVYEYRQKMEVSAPNAGGRITSSRWISEGQMLRVLISKKRVYVSQIIKNTNQYLTISRPVNKKLPPKSPWTGTKFSVFFWRVNDAGYVFESEALDEVYSLGISSLKIAHSDNLIRTQQRKSLRVKVHIVAYLYLISEGEPPHEPERRPGLKCYVEDISDSGCAVMVGGRAETGLRVKVQFVLEDAVICMTGKVRAINFDGTTGRSLLRIEAEPMPVKMKNIIYGEVFNLSVGDSENPPVDAVDADSPEGNDLSIMEDALSDESAALEEENF